MELADSIGCRCGTVHSSHEEDRRRGVACFGVRSLDRSARDLEAARAEVGQLGNSRWLCPVHGAVVDSAP